MEDEEGAGLMKGGKDATDGWWWGRVTPPGRLLGACAKSSGLMSGQVLRLGEGGVGIDAEGRPLLTLCSLLASQKPPRWGGLGGPQPHGVLVLNHHLSIIQALPQHHPSIS